MTKDAQAVTADSETPRPEWSRRLARDAFWALETLLWTTGAPFLAGAIVLWALVMVALILGWGQAEWNHVLLLIGDVLTRIGEDPELTAHFGRTLQVWVALTAGPVLLWRITHTPVVQRLAGRVQARLDRVLAPVAEPFDHQPYWVRAGVFLALMVLTGLVVDWIVS